MSAGLQRWFVLAIAVISYANAALLAGDELKTKRDGPAVTVTRDQSLVMEYRFDKAPFKPYVRQICSPGGTNVLRDAPADHLHHHGLMFAVGADAVSYWDEFPTAGKQHHQSIELAASGFVQRLAWQGPDETKASIQETRLVEISPGVVEGATLLTWRAQLSPAEGRARVTLSGNHYFGLGMRLASAMDSASMFFVAAGDASGEVVRGDERLTPGTWAACASHNGGKPVTVAMFDHPGNARPALWFTMNQPFAYLSATLNLHREPMMIEAGKPLPLCYGVAVWDGERSAAEVDKVYRRWLEMQGK